MRFPNERGSTTNAIRCPCYPHRSPTRPPSDAIKPSSHKHVFIRAAATGQPGQPLHLPRSLAALATAAFSSSVAITTRFSSLSPRLCISSFLASNLASHGPHTIW
jgi:hypothetical protein